jgi:hypothetical protein
MSSNIKEIKTVFNGLQTLYETYLQKVDPTLVHDLLLREQQNPNIAPLHGRGIYKTRNIFTSKKRFNI